MSTRPEVEHVVTSWLHETASASDGERVLARALVRVSRTPQRPGPMRWRRADMATSAKWLIGAAAAVGIVAVAMQLSPKGQAPGGVGPSPTSPTTTVQPSGGPTPSAQSGELVVSTREGVGFSLDPPAAWERRESLVGINHITRSYRGPQGAEAVIYWTIADSVDAFPCYYLRNRSSGWTASELAAALAAAPGVDIAAGPDRTTVGGRPATHVVFTVREDVGCDPGFFYAWSWQDGGAMWSETEPGDTVRVWLVEVDGLVLFLEAISHEDAGQAVDRDIQAIVESLNFR